MRNVESKEHQPKRSQLFFTTMGNVAVSWNLSEEEKNLQKEVAHDRLLDQLNAHAPDEYTIPRRLR